MDWQRWWNGSDQSSYWRLVWFHGKFNYFINIFCQFHEKQLFFWIVFYFILNKIFRQIADKCHLKFEPYSYFGGVAKKVHGTVMNGEEEKVEWVFNGTWDSKFEGAKVIGESKTRWVFSWKKLFVRGHP